MKRCASLSLVLLAATAASVSAQTDGYGPPDGTAQMPYQGIPAAPWGSGPWEPGRAGPAMPDSRVPSGPAGAAAPTPAPPADTVQANAQRLDPTVQAVAVLEEGMDKLLEFLAQDELPNKLQVSAFLDREIAPYFDFGYMAKWVAGTAYTGMTAAERKALASQLEADFLGVLARNLIGYQGQQVKLFPPWRGSRGAVSVNVALARADRYPTRLEFRMAGAERGWKVYDVVANGQSAAAYYRVQFQRTARQQLGFVPR